MNWTLITGASSGIGAATAELLASQGHNVWLVARRNERLQALVKKINGEVRTTALDLTDAKAVAKFSEEKELKNVTVLINNAGLGKGRAALQDGALKDWQTMIETNVTGLLRITHAVLPHMVKQKRGHIVNIGSVAAHYAYPGGNVYAATKAAVHMLTESLRLDVLGTGLRVSEISPGMVETEFSLVRFENEELAKKVYANMTPLTAHDVAESIAWCLSRPPHVNVQEIILYPTDQASPTHVHRS